MKTKIVVFAALSALAAGSPALAGAPAEKGTSGRVSVTFVNPQNFTDLRRSYDGGTSTVLMNELRTFMQRTGSRYVPDGMHLAIKVTNVDLAGDFEPWRGPAFDGVRILRAIYPPRIDLEFRLTNAKGAVVKSGTSDLTDLVYQMRLAWPPDDYLRYEKSLLRDWFDQEFARIGHS